MGILDVIRGALNKWILEDDGQEERKESKEDKEDIVWESRSERHKESKGNEVYIDDIIEKSTEKLKSSSKKAIDKVKEFSEERDLGEIYKGRKKKTVFTGRDKERDKINGIEYEELRNLNEKYQKLLDECGEEDREKKLEILEEWGDERHALRNKLDPSSGYVQGEISDDRIEYNSVNTLMGMNEDEYKRYSESIANTEGILPYHLKEFIDTDVRYREGYIVTRHGGIDGCVKVTVSPQENYTKTAKQIEDNYSKTYLIGDMRIFDEVGEEIYNGYVDDSQEAREKAMSVLISINGSRDAKFLTEIFKVMKEDKLTMRMEEAYNNIENEGE